VTSGFTATGVGVEEWLMKQLKNGHTYIPNCKATLHVLTAIYGRQLAMASSKTLLFIVAYRYFQNGEPVWLYLRRPTQTVRDYSLGCIYILVYCIFVGANCGVNVNECVSQPCKFGGKCEDQEDGFFCLCLPGYEGKVCDQGKFPASL
jgi:hypothetical protein